MKPGTATVSVGGIIGTEPRAGKANPATAKESAARVETVRGNAAEIEIGNVRGIGIGKNAPEPALE